MSSTQQVSLVDLQDLNCYPLIPWNGHDLLRHFPDCQPTGYGTHLIPTHNPPKYHLFEAVIPQPYHLHPQQHKTPTPPSSQPTSTPTQTRSSLQHSQPPPHPQNPSNISPRDISNQQEAFKSCSRTTHNMANDAVTLGIVLGMAILCGLVFGLFLYSQCEYEQIHNDDI